MKYSGPHLGSYSKEVTGAGVVAPHQPPSSFPNTSNVCKSSRNGSHKEAFPLPEERLTTTGTGQEGQSRTEPPGSFILWRQRAWLSSTHKTPHYTQGSGEGELLHHLPQPQSMDGAGPGPAGVLGGRAWHDPQPPMCLQRRERVTEPLLQWPDWCMEAWRAPPELRLWGSRCPRHLPSISLLRPGWDPACRALLPACCGA